jgi:dipeptidyl aminopeptidase/acylaminoacyl peptidase
MWTFQDVRTSVPRIGLLALAVVLPCALNASAHADLEAQPLARIAYLKWTCGHQLSSIVTADLLGRRRETITRPERCRHFGEDELSRDDYWPVWAPDGRSLAFRRSARERGVYIWSRGQRIRRIETDGGYDAPLWSPDGRRLAFATESLWLKSRRGGERDVLLGGRANDAWPLHLIDWSPDGSRILLLRQDDDLKIVSATGGQQRLVARDVLDAAWSPSGRRIAYAGSCFPMPGDSYDCKLYVVSANGGRPRPLPLRARDMSVIWARSGQHLLVASTDHGHGLRIVDVRMGRARTAIRGQIEFARTAGPRRDLQLIRILKFKGGQPAPASLALITSTGKIKTRIVVPRGWSTDEDEVAAYVP